MGNTMWIAPAALWKEATPPDVVRAKKDDYARRFYNKDYTSCGDLMGAVSFWLGSGMPIGSLEAWLKAIRPESGWVQEKDYDPSKPTQRNRLKYDPAYSELLSGYWKFESK